MEQRTISVEIAPPVQQGFYNVTTFTFADSESAEKRRIQFPHIAPELPAWLQKEITAFILEWNLDNI